MKIEVYVATQKEIKIPLDSCYKPIFVGAALKDEETVKQLKYLNDATGSNISDKNRSFCELTALYWMWKNSKADVVGLAHYRRYLCETGKLRDTEAILSEQQISKYMSEYDVILPKKECLLGKVRRHYGYLQHVEDYDRLRDIIRSKYPDYVDAFDQISDQDEIYICNMFIGKKASVDSYCQWLFDILFELEKQTDISEYDANEKRIFGYLSERLFNVWLLKNRMKVKEVYLLNTEETRLDRVKKYFHLFNYKVLKIDVLKYAHARTQKRKRRQAKVL